MVLFVPQDRCPSGVCFPEPPFCFYIFSQMQTSTFAHVDLTPKTHPHWFASKAKKALGPACGVSKKKFGKGFTLLLESQKDGHFVDHDSFIEKGFNWFELPKEAWEIKNGDFSRNEKGFFDGLGA